MGIGITIEPGVYYPGIGATRIKAGLVVRVKGFELFTHCNPGRDL